MSSRRGASDPTPARRVAFEVLRRTFEQGEFTDRIFRDRAAGLEGRERSQAQRLAYGAVQRRGTLDAVAGRLARRSPRNLDPPILAALRLGIYELLFSQTATHAAVNEAVELARIGGAGRGSALVNAVLRRADREREAIAEILNREDTPRQAAIAHSIPEWLAQLWWDELGSEAALSLMRAANEPAERAVRVNTSKWSVQRAEQALLAAGVEAFGGARVGRLDLPEMLTVVGPWGDITEWIDDGVIVPQSRGSAAAVAMLDPKPGESVLDLCAGPGTKTGQIAARMSCEGEIVAVELDESRAEELAGQVDRLGFTGCVETVVGDAARLDLGGRQFDRILVDAPCTDLGTLSSRPDVRWRKSMAAVERLASLQASILDRARAHLAPGGVLVYSTCTISTRENERVVAAVEQRAPDLEIDDLGQANPELASSIDSRFLQIRPDRDGTTGFFIARCVYCADPGQ